MGSPTTVFPVSVRDHSIRTPGLGANNLTPVPGRNPQPNVSQYILNQNNFSATGYTVQKYGYLEQYNLDFQRELPGGFFADVAYAGSHGVHLEQSNTNINQIPDSFIAQAASQYAAGQPVAIAQPAATYPFACPLCNPVNQPSWRSWAGRPAPGPVGSSVPTIRGLESQRIRLLRQQLQCIAGNRDPKRFQGGGTMLVSYTNSKLMSNTDTLTSWLEGGTTGGVGAVQDWNNLAGERSLSSQDVSQRLVASYVLDLPFGHGKKFLSGLSGFSNAAVSGWGVDGITTFQRGFPVKISWGGG